MDKSRGGSISYSAKSAKALGFLKKHANDVDVYVEDTGNPNMWNAILRRLLPAGTKLRSVNLLGGKQNVIDACKNDQMEDGRRKIYIVDGDLELARRKRKPNLKNLYRLKSYCIENLLISKSSLIQIGMESAPKKNEAAIVSTLKFDKVMIDIESMAKPLFILYAAIQSRCPAIKTVQNSAHALLSDANDPMVDRAKVWNLAKNLIRQAINIVGRAAIFEEIRDIFGRSKRLPGRRLVSGKDFIFPIFDRRLRATLGFRGTTEQLKVRLANEFDTRAEPSFSAAIAAL